MLFDSIYLDSFCVEENEFYRIFYSPDTLYMYDDNFLLLHYQPSLEELKVIEQNLENFAAEAGWNHLKLVWPANTGLSPEVTDYLAQQQYGLEMLELYQLEPNHFSPASLRTDVTVEPVTEATLSLFKQLSYEQDRLIGKAFADQKQALYDRLFAEEEVTLILAFLDGKPVGGMNLIESENTVEIDSLFVIEEKQKQGIGTVIQHYAVKVAGERSIILLADAEDTPRSMYRKQGYTYEGFRIGAQKERF